MLGCYPEVALHAGSSCPVFSVNTAGYLDYLTDRRIGTIVAGDDHIDMRPALEALNRRFGVKVVRVDSGGTLNSVSCMTGSWMK